MSTKIRGDAGFKYTPTSSTERVLQLARKLHDITPQHRGPRFRWESADRTATNTVVIGSGVQEYDGEIRFQGTPQQLMEFLDAGADGNTLTYYPSLADTTLSYPFLLVNAGEVQEVPPDADTWFRGEHRVRVLLRRTDSPAFDDYKTDLLLGAGTEVWLIDDGTDIYDAEPSTSGTRVYESSDGTSITEQTIKNNVFSRLYSGTIIQEDE